MKEEAFPPDATAFFFVQLGAHAADRFGERVARLQISPRQAGILRLIATTPGCNQQDLAGRLGVLPSQMVLLIDELDRASEPAALDGTIMLRPARTSCEFRP